jgi:hypothetical protein
MTDNVHEFPHGDRRDGSGGGPEDPMLEQRVAHLEEDVRDIRRSMSEMNDRMGRMEVGIAKIQARIEMLPTIWTFVVALVATVFAAVGVVIAVISAFQP